MIKNATTLSYCPFFKPSNDSIMLAGTSAHALRVHTSWPVSQMARLHNISANWECFSEARSILIQRFRDAFLDISIINECMRWRPRPKLHPASSISSKNCPIRLVLDFHPVFEACSFGKILKEITASWEQGIRRQWPGFPGVQIAWRAGQSTAPLWTILRRRHFK